MISSLLLLALSPVPSVAPAFAPSSVPSRGGGRIFFVSPGGDDAADGRAAGRAWRSLARVGREAFGPGDQIVLAEGATFEGSLEINRGGTPGRPLVIRSGKRRATILSTVGTAITVRTGGVEIRDLELKGGATAKKEGHFGIHLAAPAERRSPHIRIDRVRASGFGDSGISISAAKGSPNGFDDVRISRVDVTGVYGTAILSSDGIAFDSAGKTYAHRDFRITDCDTSENPGGAGIILSGVDRALVEYCRSANNVNLEGGGLGMWAWCARRVTFRHCLSSGTRAKGDGGGFDLDGGTVDCVVERSLSWGNTGVGYMHCDFPSAPRTQRNVMRNNISIDDGLTLKGGGGTGIGFVVWGSGLYDCRFERNLVFQTNPAMNYDDTGALFVSFIRDGKTALGNQRLEGAVFSENVVQLASPGARFVSDNFPADVTKTITYRNNSYRGPGVFVVGKEPTRRYEMLAEWRSASGDGARPPRSDFEHGEYRSLRPRDLPAYLRKLGR